jgi:hypothetical protein
MLKKFIILTTLIIGALSLNGCSEAGMMLTKNEVQTSTKMSDTIFLDPAETNQKIAFIDIKNTTDNPNLNITELVKNKIEARGYKITNSPSKAHYLVQANILQAGKFTKEKANSVLKGGYGSALEGGAIGAGVGSLIGRGDSTLGGAIAGAAIGFAANALIKDVMYGTVVDVQIGEKAAKGVKVTEDHGSILKQGTSGGKLQYSTETTNWKRYRTRIISVANKINLTEEEATPYLVAGISQSISGIL